MERVLHMNIATIYWFMLPTIVIFHMLDKQKRNKYNLLSFFRWWESHWTFDWKWSQCQFCVIWKRNNAIALCCFKTQVKYKCKDLTTKWSIIDWLTGSEKVVDLLIKNGASVNLPDIHGDNPLHYATLNGKLDV